MFKRRNLTRIVTIQPSLLGKDIEPALLLNLRKDVEGKCITEGYVRKGTINIYKISLGKIDSITGNIKYQVSFSSEILYPAEGMEFQCKVLSVMKMGIRGSLNEDESPIDVLIPRDHYVEDPEYQALKEGDIFTAKVMGHKFQYGDKEIFVLASLVKPEKPAAPLPTSEILETENFVVPEGIIMGSDSDVKTINIDAIPDAPASMDGIKTLVLEPTPAKKKRISKKKSADATE